MKITELKGHWFSPLDKERIVAGVLQLKNDGLTLNVIGSLDNSFLLNQMFEIIIGKTSEGPVTLINSFVRYSSNPFSKERIPYQTFTVNYCIIGEAFEDIDGIKFTVCAFRFQYLEFWAHDHGFKKNFYEHKINKKGKKHLIDYKQPSQVKLYKNRLFEIFLFFSVQQSFAGITKRNASITEKTYLNIYFKRSSSLFEILKLIYSLKTLHTLPISNPSKITEIDFWISKSDNKKISFISKEILEPELSEVNFNNVLGLTSEELKIQVPMIFKNWLEKLDKLSSVYELYYNSIYIDKRFGRTEFLNLVFALETMHRRLIGGESIKIEQYEQLLNKVKSVLNQEEQKLLIDRMKYLYQFSLRTRLKNLSNQFEFLFKQYNEKKSDFINHVVNTRNYYVHFDESLKSQIINDDQFPYYNFILRILLDSFLLSELGLSTDQIIKFIKRQSHTYRLKK